MSLKISDARAREDAYATGRTAAENELREAIARMIEPEAFSIVDTGNADPKGWAIPLVGGARHTADRLLSGPLAPILQEAATARKERDEARRKMRHNMVPISKDSTHVFVDGMGDVPLDWSQGQDLIALAKMYGEACGQLALFHWFLDRCANEDEVVARILVEAGQERRDAYDCAQAAEQEAATLRARLQEAEKDGEAWKRVAVIAAIPLEAMRMAGSYRALAPSTQTSVDEAVVTIRMAVVGHILPPEGNLDAGLALARAALAAKAAPLPESDTGGRDRESA